MEGPIIPIFRSCDHRGHVGAIKMRYDRLIPMCESPKCTDTILAALKYKGYGDFAEASSFGIERVLRIHTPGFVDFVQRCWTPSVKPSAAPAALRPPACSACVEWTRFPMPASTRCCPAQPLMPACVSSPGHGPPSGPRSTLRCRPPAMLPRGAAFALCRPPGHCPSADLADGYCGSLGSLGSASSERGPPHYTSQVPPSSGRK